MSRDLPRHLTKCAKCDAPALRYETTCFEHFKYVKAVKVAKRTRRPTPSLMSVVREARTVAVLDDHHQEVTYRDPGPSAWWRTPVLKEEAA